MVERGRTYELLLLATVLDLDNGLRVLVDDLEGPVLHVGLNLGLGELSANQSLGVENGVVGVHGDLVLGGITDQSLRVVEGDVRRSGSVSLVVGDNLDSLVRPDTDTRVGRTLRMSASDDGRMMETRAAIRCSLPYVCTHQVNTDSLNHDVCVICV